MLSPGDKVDLEGVKQIVGKDSRYKLFWPGKDDATGGVGVLLAEEWWEKVFEVVRVSDRIILIRMTIGKTVFVFVCVYAPQANLCEFAKDRFYQMLQCTVAKIPASEQLFVCGDWNGHIGSQSTWFEEVHGGQAIGKRKTDGERVLEFAFANELVVGNTWFKLWSHRANRRETDKKSFHPFVSGRIRLMSVSNPVNLFLVR